MSDFNSRVVLTPADFADTGQWRLIIHISRRGMRAFLKHLSDKSRPMAEMLSVEWEDEDAGSLLAKIENAVYDHPGLLDDYATELILETPRVTFVPNVYLDECDDSEEEIFTTLFPGSDQEILSDRLPEYTALFTLARGLDPFIARTIPGARIRSHLAVLAERFRRQRAEGPRVYADIRIGEADILAFRNEELLSASVQSWRHPADIAYRIFNLINVLGLKPEETSVILSGSPDVKKEVETLIRDYCREILPAPLPVNLPEGTSLPTSVILQAFR